MVQEQRTVLSFFATGSQNTKLGQGARQHAGSSSTQVPKPAQSSMPRAKSETSASQTFLDLGQKGFSSTKCPRCGMLYAPGVGVDEELHRKSCGVEVVFKLQAIPAQLTVCNLAAGRLVCINPKEGAAFKKAQELCGAVEQAMGYEAGSFITPQVVKVYACIAPGMEVVALAITEMPRTAWRHVMPPPPQQRLQSLPCLPQGAAEVDRSTVPVGAATAASSAAAVASAAELEVDSSRHQQQQQLAGPAVAAAEDERDAKRACIRPYGSQAQAPLACSPPSSLSSPPQLPVASAGAGASSVFSARAAGRLSSTTVTVVTAAGAAAGPGAAPSTSAPAPASSTGGQWEKGRATCAVRMLWVSPKSAYSGLAAQVLDAVRSHAVHGYVVPKQELSFNTLVLAPDAMAMLRQYVQPVQPLLYSDAGVPPSAL